MPLGLLVFGVLAGLSSSGAALFAGHSLWLALLLYAVVGMTATLLAAVLALLPGQATAARAVGQARTIRSAVS